MCCCILCPSLSVIQCTTSTTFLTSDSAQEGPSAEDDEVQAEALDVLAVKLHPYGGVCWWCHLFAHDPDACSAKGHPNMKDFKQLRLSDMESGEEEVTRCLCRGCTGLASVAQKKLLSRAQGEHTQAYCTSYNKQRRALELNAQKVASEQAELALIPPSGAGPLGCFTTYQLLTLEFALDLVSQLNEEQRKRSPTALNHAAV